MKKVKSSSNVIALNRKARFSYEILETFESGVALQGWEVKSIREGKVQIAEAYVLLKKSELWLFNCIINPLLSASTHVIPEASGSRKLLMHRKEINNLLGKVEQKGFTLVPLKMYWKGHRVKLEIALARGKNLYDKRHALKAQEWSREKERLKKIR